MNNLKKLKLYQFRIASSGFGQFSNYLNFFSKLSGVHGSLDLVFRFTFLASESVFSVAILRLTLSEADADVALELDGVAVREFEGVERSREESLLTVVLPFSENIRIRRTSVLVRHRVHGLLVVVVDGSRDAVSGESAVNFSGRNLNLEHELVSDLGLGDVLPVGIGYAHGTGGRRASVGDGARGGEGRNVEAEVDVLLAGVVHAFDAVGLGLVRHQFRMFLNDKHEFGFSLK